MSRFEELDEQIAGLRKRIEALELFFGLASEQSKEEARVNFLRKRQERREKWRADSVNGE